MEGVSDFTWELAEQVRKDLDGDRCFDLMLQEIETESGGVLVMAHRQEDNTKS